MLSEQPGPATEIFVAYYVWSFGKAATPPKEALICSSLSLDGLQREVMAEAIDHTLLEWNDEQGRFGEPAFVDLTPRPGCQFRLPVQTLDVPLGGHYRLERWVVPGSYG